MRAHPSVDGMGLKQGTLETSVYCAIFLKVVTASGLNPGVRSGADAVPQRRSHLGFRSTIRT